MLLRRTSGVQSEKAPGYMYILYSLAICTYVYMDDITLLSTV